MKLTGCFKMWLMELPLYMLLCSSTKERKKVTHCHLINKHPIVTWPPLLERGAGREGHLGPELFTWACVIGLICEQKLGGSPGAASIHGEGGAQKILVRIHVCKILSLAFLGEHVSLAFCEQKLWGAPGATSIHAEGGVQKILVRPTCVQNFKLDPNPLIHGSKVYLFLKPSFF